MRSFHKCPKVMWWLSDTWLCVCVCFFRRFLKLRNFRFQRRFVTNDSRFVWEWQVVHSILSGSGSTLKAETSSPNLFQSFTAYDLNRKVPLLKNRGEWMAKCSSCHSVCVCVLLSFEDQYLNLKLFDFWYHVVFCLKSCVYSKTVWLFPFFLPDWLILKNGFFSRVKMRCFQEEAQAAHTQNSRRKYAKMRSLEWIWRVLNYSHQKNTTSQKSGWWKSRLVK